MALEWPASGKYRSVRIHCCIRWSITEFFCCPGHGPEDMGEGMGDLRCRNAGISPDTILDGREILSRQRFGVDAREGRSG